jgi:UDP-3-O-[3-hydroxymyristoyl] glucosamine N-acyltransferase
MRLSEVATLLGGRRREGPDPWITGVASLTDAGPGDLCFVAGPERLAEAQASAAEALNSGCG